MRKGEVVKVAKNLFDECSQSHRHLSTKAPIAWAHKLQIFMSAESSRSVFLTPKNSRFKALHF